MSARESLLRSKIKRALEREGAFVKVLHGSAEQAGLPDLLVVYDGCTLFMEVKRNDDDAFTALTPLQASTFALMARAGAIVWVVRSVDDAIANLRRTIRNASKPSSGLLVEVQATIHYESKRVARKKTGAAPRKDRAADRARARRSERA